MDEISPPSQLEYASPVDEPVPSSIQVISIIGIVWGSLTLLSRLFGAVGAIVMIALNNKRSPMGMGYSVFSIISALVFAGFSIWLIICSIGCLKRLEWARVWLVRYAIVYSIAVLLEVVGAVITVLPMMSKIMTQANGGKPGPFPPAVMVAFMVGGSGIGAIIALILPAFIWIYMRRPEVRMAFLTPNPQV